MWHGVRLGEPDWGAASRSLAMHLAGEHAAEPDCDIYLAANAWEEDLVFALPAPPPGRNGRASSTPREPSPGDIAALGEERAIERTRRRSSSVPVRASCSAACDDWNTSRG